VINASKGGQGGTANGTGGMVLLTIEGGAPIRTAWISLANDKKMRINALPKVCCSQGVKRFRENLHSLCDPPAAGQAKHDRGVVPGKMARGVCCWR
jgi:hypothetical protein